MMSKTSHILAAFLALALGIFSLWRPEIFLLLSTALGFAHYVLGRDVITGFYRKSRSLSTSLLISFAAGATFFIVPLPISFAIHFAFSQMFFFEKQTSPHSWSLPRLLLHLAFYCALVFPTVSLYPLSPTVLSFSPHPFAMVFYLCALGDLLLQLRQKNLSFIRSGMVLIMALVVMLRSPEVDYFILTAGLHFLQWFFYALRDSRESETGTFIGSHVSIFALCGLVWWSRDHLAFDMRTPYFTSFYFLSHVHIFFTLINSRHNPSWLRNFSHKLTRPVSIIVALWVFPLNSAIACLPRVAGDEMIRVGQWCVDKYEASVCEIRHGRAQTCFFTESSPHSSSAPARMLNVLPNLKRDGAIHHAAQNFQAISLQGSFPARGLTWLQAQSLCVAAGKQLVPDDIWLAAVRDTRPRRLSTEAKGAVDCNVGQASLRKACWPNTTLGVRRTGAHPDNTKRPCERSLGMVDGVGNLWEWTALALTNAPRVTRRRPFAQLLQMDLGLGGVSYNVGGQVLGLDAELVSSENATPAAMLRGGSYADGPEIDDLSFSVAAPLDYAHPLIGFRCARFSPH